MGLLSRRKRFDEGRCYQCGKPRQVGTWCRKCFTKMQKKAARRARREK